MWSGHAPHIRYVYLFKLYGAPYELCIEPWMSADTLPASCKYSRVCTLADWLRKPQTPDEPSIHVNSHPEMCSNTHVILWIHPVAHAVDLYFLELHRARAYCHTYIPFHDLLRIKENYSWYGWPTYWDKKIFLVVPTFNVIELWLWSANEVDESKSILRL